MSGYGLTCRLTVLPFKFITISIFMKNKLHSHQSLFLFTKSKLQKGPPLLLLPSRCQLLFYQLQEFQSTGGPFAWANVTNCKWCFHSCFIADCCCYYSCYLQTKPLSSSQDICKKQHKHCNLKKSTCTNARLQQKNQHNLK